MADPTPMRRAFAVLATAALVLLGTAVLPAAPAGAAEPEYRVIHFPVEGAVSFTDDFGAPRSGGRTHQGNDLFGQKLQKLLSAVDGVVTHVRTDPSTALGGSSITVKDTSGWTYLYVHLNNDSPGTDDGTNPPEWILAPGIKVGSVVSAGQHIAYLGDSGNAETTPPHLHFEIRRPNGGGSINPWTSLRLAKGLPAGTRCAYDTNPTSAPDAEANPGYWILGTDGGVFSFGDAEFHGSVPGLELPAPVAGVRLTASPSGQGYWVLGGDGGIFSFGDATFHGSVPGLGLHGVTGVDLQPTPDGDGYWVLGADGGIFSFGEADFHGSVPDLGLRGVKAIRLVPTPSGAGYWVLGADGGVFSFGDAEFAGSVPGLGIRTTSIAMAANPEGGYWVLGADGGIFSFDTPFHGSIPGLGYCRWTDGVQLSGTPAGGGYWILGADGGIYSFGDAAYHGAPNALGLATTPRVIDLAPLPAAVLADEGDVR